MSTLFCPDMLLVDGAFVEGKGLLASDDGRIIGVVPKSEAEAAAIVELPGKVMLPGFVNAHSHSFQRLIRGKAESRIVSGKDFWSWRGTMYHAASQLSPEDTYDVARMCFLEMLASGTTTVGEFHYLHTDPQGRPYDDSNLLARQIIAAARSVGMRIVLLRSAYLRSGYELPCDSGQTRFFETTSAFLESMGGLIEDYPNDPDGVRFGVAPHSIRAVPLDDLKEIATWGRGKDLPVHMHVAEQVAENDACLREYGCTPVELLARNGILQAGFTAVHAIHVQAHEIAEMASHNAIICSCPTTERNLGDGILAANDVMAAGVRIAFGSDSQAQIDPLEDARELDYHLRLQLQQRAILDQIDGQSIASRLIGCATRHGAEALSIPAGEFVPGNFADAFTVSTSDLSLACNSAEDLLPMIVFGMNRTAIRDVVVGGSMVVRDGTHPLQGEIVAKYGEVYRKVWGGAGKGVRA